MRPIIALFCLLALVGCGSGSTSGAFFSTEKGHPEHWADPLHIGRSDFHGTAIKDVQTGVEGARLFSVHCAPCHGENGEGKIGPNIQSDTLPLIIQAINIVPLMSGHSILTEAELEEIAAYIPSLSTGSPAVNILIDTGVCTQCHRKDLDDGISMVSCFSCHNGPDGKIGHPPGWLDQASDRPHFHGRYGKDFVDACRTCHGFALNGYIGPACSKCHGVTAPPL